MNILNKFAGCILLSHHLMAILTSFQFHCQVMFCLSLQHETAKEIFPYHLRCYPVTSFTILLLVLQWQFFQSSSWHARSFDWVSLYKNMLYSLAWYHMYTIITMDNIIIVIDLFLLLTGIITFSHATIVIAV